MRDRGSIKLKSSGNYALVVDMGKDPATGKRLQHYETLRTKGEAQERRTKLLSQRDTGSYLKPGKATVAEYLNRWLRDYGAANISPRGLDRYAGIISKYFIPQFGSIQLAELKPEHLQKHYADCQSKGLCAGTIRYHHSVVHKALKTAVEWGLIARNVADAVKPPRRTHKEMQTWDALEVNRFLESSKDSNYFSLFHLALYTGMRRSELLALTWQDADLLTCQVSVKRGLHQLRNGSFVFSQTKSSKSRRNIALPPSAAIQLRLYREKRKLECEMLGIPLKDNSLVFSTFEGKPLRPNTVTRAWSTLAARAGLKVIRLHDARHTHASLLLKQGVHPKIVQERLGHSTIAMTLDLYSHVAPGLQEAAASKFDELLNPVATDRR